VRPSGEITPPDSTLTPAGGVSKKRMAGGCAGDGFHEMPTMALVVNENATPTTAAISADLGTPSGTCSGGVVRADSPETVGGSRLPGGCLRTSTSSLYPRLGTVRM